MPSNRLTYAMKGRIGFRVRSPVCLPAASMVLTNDPTAEPNPTNTFVTALNAFPIGPPTGTVAATADTDGRSCAGGVAPDPAPTDPVGTDAVASEVRDPAASGVDGSTSAMPTADTNRSSVMNLASGPPGAPA